MSHPRKFYLREDKADVQTFEYLASETPFFDDDIQAIELDTRQLNTLLNGLCNIVQDRETKLNKLYNDYDNRMLEPDYYGEPGELQGPINRLRETQSEDVKLLFNLGDSSDYFGGLERHEIVRLYKHYEKENN